MKNPVIIAQLEECYNLDMKELDYFDFCKELAEETCEWEADFPVKAYESLDAWADNCTGSFGRLCLYQFKIELGLYGKSGKRNARSNWLDSFNLLKYAEFYLGKDGIQRVRQHQLTYWRNAQAKTRAKAEKAEKAEH